MPDVTFRQGQISMDALRAALRAHTPRGRDIAWVGHIAHTAEFEPMTIVGLTPDQHGALVAALEAGGAEVVDHPDGRVAAGGEVEVTAAELVAARAADLRAGAAATGNGALHRRAVVGSIVIAGRERAVAAAVAAVIVAGVIKIAA